MPGLCDHQSGAAASGNNRPSGAWEYRYDRHSQLIWQKDSQASRKLTCLYYDEYGRLRGKHFKGDYTTCDPLAANDHENYLYGTSGSAQGQLIQVTLRDSVNGAVAYQKNYAYNAAGQLETETVAYPLLGQQYAATYAYENVSGRLKIIYYPTNFTPNNERVEYEYNGMGLVEKVHSNVQGNIVEAVSYDVLGRTTSLRYSGTLNTQYVYYPWTSANGDSNARLRDIRVGASLGGNGKLSLSYNYDSFGNITSLGEMYRNANYAVHSFDYDDLSRLQTSIYSGLPALEYRTKYDGRPLLYEGQTNNYADPAQPQAVDYITSTLGIRLNYTRDGNGNAAVREFMNGGSKVTQTLEWNRSNQLQQVKVGTQVLETYRYDAQGLRTYKANAAGTTVYPFPFFEVEGATATRYYLLNGQPIALRTGTDAVTVLQRDQVGSVVMTTLLNGAVLQDRRYYAYGNKRSGSDFAFEQEYTGQRRDVTGLLYYNARYYDPALGQFISPDSLIPDPTDYFSYNRYLYAHANPLKYHDPTGHCPKPPEGYANAICVAGFIPTKESEGAPGGVIIYEADNRDFSSDSTGQSSRFYVWIDAETGKFIGDPKDNVHPTVQLSPPQQWLGGGEHQARDSHNRFYLQKFDDGSIYFSYSVVCAGPNCLYAPGPEGELVFTPNDSGSFDVMGTVEGFPNLEAYHWSNGELTTPNLFQVQNYSQAELDSGRASFWTGLRMYDWWFTSPQYLQTQEQPYE